MLLVDFFMLPLLSYKKKKMALFCSGNVVGISTSKAF